ncbi:neural-cadherin-like [Palaemon carinicauda]|uniref:neural-cadherin-like n=1 Tax=Palaemon carinicauda TaxID=392227 RepID=UPI0035B672AB
MEAILQVITNSTLLVTKFFRAGLADNNEHPPFFDQSVYEAEVAEDEAIGTTVLSVAAQDQDEISHIRYNISDGNWDDVFVINPLTGDLLVARPLDYEVTNKYNLSVSAFDGRHDAFTCVLIDITDINDNPPVFDRPVYEAEVVEEEDKRKLPRKILTVSITDADSDRENNVVFSLSGEGIDVKNPHNSHFAIDPATGDIFVRKALDRDFPDGRPVWAMTVFAQDEGGVGLVSYSEVLVTVKDINDNPPVFKQAMYHCNVTENDAKGISVIRMEAEDYDDPNEGTNAKITYSITKNAIDEATAKPVFEIDAQSGEIKTRVCCLDRERTPRYLLQVVAMDGGGLNGTTTANVLVLDVNDSPPRFAKGFWRAEVDESVQTAITNRPILNVTVVDEDDTNDFYFAILDTYESAAKTFTIEPSSDGVGAIRLSKPLDYEDPVHILGFKFQIVVSDIGEITSDKSHTAYSWVEIRIKDVNDNAPVFKENSIEVVVSENIVTGTTLCTFVATDVDKEGRSEISYTIDPKSDKRRQFLIDRDGTVKLQRPLDREITPRYFLRIEASDDGVPQKTSTATLVINVRDENDSAPRLSQEYHPILQENQPPKEIIEVSAIDDDDASRGNGPPFHFALDLLTSTADVKSSFAVKYNAKGDDWKGTAVVSSLRGFDREVQKEYYLPIVIVDSGFPPMTGTSTLIIIIGDENDSLMLPGEKQVLVYTHKNISQETHIGRIYVHDPDDWDLVDKTFTWANKPHQNFLLDEGSGMITMTAATRGGLYFLEFLVQDHKHSQYNVKASVSVSVNYIPERVVEEAASLRIANITDEDFIQTWDYRAKDFIPSKADLFRKEISNLLNTNKEDVHIFSLNLRQKRPPITDIRFTVFDGQYYQSGMLNALLIEHKEEIERNVGLNIVMIGINECLDENVPCDGSCTSKLIISDKPYLVDANRTSLVSVDVKVIPDCTCQAKDFTTKDVRQQVSCRPNPCKNEGKCIKEKSSIRCECPKGYRGPRCQMLIRTFETNGYCWFPSLATCAVNHLSMEFLTVQMQGLLIFNDALALSQDDGQFTSDFISLELENGQPRLLLDYGSGTVQLKINGTHSLADGQWHRIDLFWDTEEVRIEVDHCMTAVDQEHTPEIDGSFDTSSCRAVSSIPPFNRFLNVNGPLQVGGIRHYSFKRNTEDNKLIPNGKSFSGCIRNLMMNGHFYDFSQPVLHDNTDLRCKPLEEICKSNVNSTADNAMTLCYQGSCEGSLQHATCKCHPGWTGLTCSDRTVPAYFGNDSYVKYSLSFKPKTYGTTVQLRFRTWEEDGVLFYISDQHNQEYGILEIEESHLLFRFSTNTQSRDERNLQISHVAVSDGEWHLASVARFGSKVILSLDEGDGKWYNESFEEDLRYHFLDIDIHEGVIVGGMYHYSGIGALTVEEDFRQGCIDDIRLDGHPLPLPPNVNGTQWAQATVFQNLVEKCISKDQCINVECLAPFICKSLWMKHECSCKEGSVLSKDHMRCVQVDVCFHDPCLNGGTCFVQESSYTCSCPQGYQGTNCQLAYEPANSRVTLGAMAILIFCLIIIIAGVLVFVVYKKRKRRRRLGKQEAHEMKGLHISDFAKHGPAGIGQDVMVGKTLDLTAIVLPPEADHQHEKFGSNCTSGAEKVGSVSSVDVIMNIQGTKEYEPLPNILHDDCILRAPSAFCEGQAQRIADHSPMVHASSTSCLHIGHHGIGISRQLSDYPQLTPSLSRSENFNPQSTSKEGRDLRS